MQNSTVETIAAINKSIPDGDPVIDAAKWVFLLLSLIGAATYPILVLIRRKNRDSNENLIDTAMSTAGSTLYEQLVRQVQEYRSLADTAYKERSELSERLHALELEEANRKHELAIYRAAAAKLEQKEKEIVLLIAQAAEERAKFLQVLSEKEAAINMRDSRILHLENSVRELELRLARDEARQGLCDKTCPHARPNSAVVVDG